MCQLDYQIIQKKSHLPLLPLSYEAIPYLSASVLLRASCMHLLRPTWTCVVANPLETMRMRKEDDICSEEKIRLAELKKANQKLTLSY